MREQQSEYEIQKAFVKWCRSHRDDRAHRIYAIANESRRSWSHAQKRISEGMVAGVADLHLPVPVRSKEHPKLFRYPGLFIEVKTPIGQLSKTQREFMLQCKADDYPYHVIRTLADGYNLIEWYLSL